MFKRGIDSAVAEHLMQRYLNDAARQHSEKIESAKNQGIDIANIKPFDRSSERSNLCTHLASPDMTLKSFHKCLRFARAVEVTHIVVAKWPNGTVEEYSVNLELNDEDQPESNDVPNV